MAETPEEVKKHQADYIPGKWEEYTFSELGNWVHLFAKRSQNRANPEKRAKDLEDAQNYLSMMQAKLDELKGGDGVR